MSVLGGLGAARLIGTRIRALVQGNGQRFRVGTGLLRKFVCRAVVTFVAAMLLAPSSGHADPVTIDFESLPDPVGIAQSIGSSTYSEGGFTLTASGGDEFNILGPVASRYIGSKALFHPREFVGVTTLTQDDSGTFTLISIDLADVNLPIGQASATFTGNLVGGGSIEQSFDIPAITPPGAATFAFNSGFTNLVSVSWPQGFPIHQFDNIVVVADPVVTYTFTKIAEVGGVLSGLFTDPAISNDGTVVSLDVGLNLIFTGQGGEIVIGDYTIIASESGPFTFLSIPTINASNTVAFGGALDIGGSGIFTGQGGEIVLGDYTDIANTNDDPFGGIATSSAFINDAGTVAFLAFPNTGGEGVFIGNSGPITTIADTSGPFSDFGGTFLGIASINSSDTVAFEADLDAGGSGIFTGQGGEIVIGDYTTIADTSGPFSQFFNGEGAPIINDDGTVVFFAALDAGGSGIFTGQGGETAIGDYTTIANTSGPYSLFFRSPSINNVGTVAFHAFLDGGGEGIFTGPDPIADKVIADGDTLFGSTVVGQSFGAQGINDFGQLTFIVSLADGREIVVRADPVLKIILSPVVGPIHICTDPSDTPDCPFASDTWEFWQHKTGFHRAGGGIGGSDETFAWDVNLAPEPADRGKLVYAVAPGKVVKYAGSKRPGGKSGAVLLEHNQNGQIWWSGYLHMNVDKNIKEGLDVDEITVLGEISNKASTGVGEINNHLHFVVYSGQNLPGDLISTDANIVESPDTVDPVVMLKRKNLKRIRSDQFFVIRWTSTDDVVVASHDVLFSEDGGLTFPTVIASNLPGTAQTFEWDVPASILTTQGRIRVIARDGNGNPGQDSSLKNITVSP